MVAALGDIARTIEQMALGEADRKLFLSDLDPGTGKSTVIKASIDALLTQQAYAHVGVLLCVSRLSEIESMVHDMGIPEGMLHVLTRDDAVNALGKAPINEAQVLITTQQMVESRLRFYPSFEAADLFFYRGQPRQVRLWDESFSVGQAITLNPADLGFLFPVLQRFKPDLYQSIRRLFNAASEATDGMVYEVEDFAAKHGVDLNDVLGLFDEDGKDKEERTLRDDQRHAATSLWYISGKTVTVRLDGRFGHTVIDYRDTMPLDLAPMLITDASGRVRDGYRDMQDERRILVKLESAPKSYEPLTVHVWKRGGGKSSFQGSTGVDLLDGIAKTVDTKPGERWLIVHHRADGFRVGDVEKEIRKRVKATPGDNLAFISWGNHQATNAYVDYENVILAGTLYYRPSFYEALKRLNADRPSGAGRVTQEEIERVMLGEHAHLILQALCRGRVRKCDGEKCAPMHAYVIASMRSHIPQALPAIFPGCTVNPWKPIEVPLSGRVAKVVAYVERWLASSATTDVLSFKTICHDLRIGSTDFGNNIRKNPAFRDALAELSLEEWTTGKRYFTCFRRVVCGYGFVEDAA
ncbi:MAG TPA: hypothetical protein VEL07_13810 [Planctomycetota bacterium]|nr:hypothetical protein [Planctomycetota bacterium]